MEDQFSLPRLKTDSDLFIRNASSSQARSMSFSLSSTSTSLHLLPRRRLVEIQTASANGSISEANMNIKMFNRNSGMEIGGMEGVDPVRVQRSTKTSTRNDTDGDPVFKLQRKLTPKSEKPERQVRFREKSVLSPEHESGDQQEEHHHDDENGFKCERLRSAAGFGVDLSTYPEAAPYSVFLASLQRFIPRRIVHRPHLHVGDEKDTDEHKAPEKEQDLFAELRKNQKQPWEYVGEIEFDFDAEDYSDPGYLGSSRVSKSSVGVLEGRASVRLRSHGASSVALNPLDQWRLLLAQMPGPRMHVPADMRALAASLGLKLTHPAQLAYLISCRAFSESPCRQILAGLPGIKLEVADYELSHDAFLPACISFQVSPQITILRLMGNNLAEAGAKQLAEVISERILQLKELAVTENDLRAAGLRHIVNAILSSPGIELLDISGNLLGDPGAVVLAQFIKANRHVVELRATNNAFFEVGLREIGNAIYADRTLRTLDLSWNHIRLKGAVYLLDALSMNTSLKNVNLSWNGLSMWETKKLCKFLSNNTTITNLDISYNRLDKTSMDMVTNFGIIKNQSLETLKGTPIDSHCDQVAKQISKVTRRFFLIYYHFIKTMTQPEENEDVFHNEDPMMVLIEYLKMKNLRLLDLFKSLDSDGSHSIKHKEFRSGLTNLGVPLATSSVNRLIDTLDRDGDGEIDYMELQMGQREHSRRLQIVKLAEKNKPFEETELGRIQIKLKHTLARRDEKRRVEQLKKREARAAQQGLVPGGQSQSQSQGGSVNPSVNIAAPATGTSGSGEGPGSRSGSRPPTRGKGQPEQEESGPQIPKNSRPAARVGTVGGTGSRDGSRNGSRSSSRMRSGSGQAFIGNDNPSKSNARGAPVKQTSLQELPLEAVEKTISKTEEEKKLVEESL